MMFFINNMTYNFFFSSYLIDEIVHRGVEKSFTCINPYTFNEHIQNNKDEVVQLIANIILTVDDDRIALVLIETK